MIGWLLKLVPGELRTAGLVLVAGAGAAFVTTLGAVAYDRLLDDPAVIAEARRGFVAEATVASLEARLVAHREIAARMADLADERNRRLRVAIDAQLGLAARLADIRTEKESLNDDVADLLASPIGAACAVDASLAGRMRAP